MDRQLEVAWAAGLFEGEGSLTWSKNRARASLLTTDKDVIDRFHAIVGVGFLATVKRTASARPHYKPAWVWAANGDDLLAVVALFRPYMGERRAARADEVVAGLAAHRLAIKGPRPCGNCGTVFEPRHYPRAGVQKFCSDRCYRDIRNARRRVAWAEQETP